MANPMIRAANTTAALIGYAVAGFVIVAVTRHIRDIGVLAWR